eukprot:TRINITY_DN2031_c0_g1_i1.p1 TRINITY_DN2031_c0_g1~~TRINITY_DN2031_c0_g1_i1.p1  ORF type:complete len:186 (+),score=5.27 TRINITY_DN2031_c0_g1_i1:127-684(+)
MQDNYFEWSKHAYIRICVYFIFFGFVSAGMGVWCMTSINAHGLAVKLPTDKDFPTDCSDINTFLNMFGTLSLAQTVVHFLLAWALYKFQGKCAYFVLVLTFTLYVVLLMGQTASVALGALWIWGDNASFCEKRARELFIHGSAILSVVLLAMAFQACLGSCWLIYRGICTATAEATHNLLPSEEP